MAKISNVGLTYEKHRVRGFIDFKVGADLTFEGDERERDWEVEMTLLEIDVPQHKFERIRTYHERVRPKRKPHKEPRFTSEETITKEELQKQLRGEWTREEIFAFVRLIPKVAYQEGQDDLAFSNIERLFAWGKD